MGIKRLLGLMNKYNTVIPNKDKTYLGTRGNESIPLKVTPETRFSHKRNQDEI